MQTAPLGLKVQPFRNAWLIGPYTDFFLFILTPLLVLPFFQFLSIFFSLATLKLAILSVSASGHHLPGFIRAYTDKKIFAQFKLRLLLVPPLFILLTGLAAYYKLTLVFFVLITWSVWHGGMQILGFLRIYDVRAKFMSTLTARIDYGMCLAWFVQVVLWSIPKKVSVLSTFYLSGGPFISTHWASLMETGWLVFTGLITLIYVINLGYNFIRHRYFNLPKFLCMVFSFGLWAYCIISVQNLVVGLILWEIFHDLQYNVFVWSYNRQRVQRQLSQSPVEQFLFQLNWKKITFYSLCIVGYGTLGLLSQDVLHLYQNQKTHDTLIFQIGNIFAASALIHFYLDGFIWKVRDGKVQQDLGVETAASYRPRSLAIHWPLLILFLVGAGYLGHAEYQQHHRPDAKILADNLADLVPKSGYANFMKATRLQSENQADSAILYFDKAIQFDTSFNFSQVYIADLMFKQGNLPGSLERYEMAAKQDPEDMEIRDNLAEVSYQLGFSFLQMKKGLAAKPYLEKSLELNPNQPLALNYLGMIEQAEGHLEQARQLYQKSLALDSGYAHARENLSALKP